ncbi:acetyltransferase [Flavobacterium covae]|uniref:acetyltransferase n=1 Tax=Flavobacterium covae TaxID=2906076 RepID=UPI000B5BA77A|nr:acetyltransferase [Flavobacterium covae]MCJ1805901.1 acetyltransferase [Flavobacterium covae]OXA80181.1 hypothetical protein B0A56_07155 [Flavobacterium columnare NBRC 100251 = ATCC 23463]
MKKIVFIGCGAVSAEITSYLSESIGSEYEIVGFIDDSEENFNINSRKYGLKYNYLGTIDTHVFSSKFSYIFGLASPIVKNKILSKINYKGLNFPNIIHPSCIIDVSAKLGVGNVINPNSIIGPGVEMADFNLLTSYSFVSHDCIVGNNNFFSTAGLSGNVKVGNNNFFGIRSCIIPSVIIGDNNVIQAGMVVDKDVENNATIFYKYKEKLTVIK